MPRFGRSISIVSAVASGSALLALLAPATSRGHENEPGQPAQSTSAAAIASEAPPQQITVTADKGYSAASADEIRQRDLSLRPRLRPADILEVVPGLFAVQHAGGGKANQYFLRGFDADHGTDIAFFVDGVPINMVSHAHGQGYTDLNFIIPELVSTLSSQKGPYAAKYGDFATAGAIDLKYYDHLHESSASFSVGQYGILRGLFMVAPELGDDWSTIVAGEAYADNGPFLNKEHLARFNGFGRATRHMGPGALSLTFMSYTGAWNASGQIPQRAIGRLPTLPDAFGYVDETDGGSTQRHQLSVSYAYKKDGDEARALLYAIKYRLTLFSDFTFFLTDQVNGDQIEQDDERTVLGTHWYYRRTKELGPFTSTTTFGMQARNDSIESGLHHTVGRKLVESRPDQPGVLDAGVNETSVGLYVEEDLKITSYLRVVAGVRADRFDVAVKDHLDSFGSGHASSGGTNGGQLVSPKMSAVFSPLPHLDFFANFGRGFHSNDARGTSGQLDPRHTVTLLTKATGWEIGARARPFDGLDLGVALFRLDLDNEIVWSGDTGSTEERGPTRRIGAELEARLRLWRWLFLDADATFTRATFVANAGNANAVALAPTRTLSAGVGFKHPSGLFGSLRMRAIARRPANDGDARDPAKGGTPLDADGWTIFDAMAGYRYKDVEVALDVRNLFNAQWKEVQFASTSQLKTESAPRQDIHFTPGWPFTAMARVTVYF